MNQFYLGKKSLSNLIGVYAPVAFCCTEAIKITKQDFTIFDGIRTIAEQRKMVESGASDTMDSYHLYGLAVDVVAWINGKVRWEVEPNQIVKKAMMEVNKAHGLGIDNGYDMWGWDIYHNQLTGFKSMYDIRKLA